MIAAADFDTLVDSPIVAGNAAIYEFTVDGTPHHLVNQGEGGVFDGARAARDVESLVREQRRFWGQLPYDRYLVLNVIGQTRGGEAAPRFIFARGAIIPQES